MRGIGHQIHAVVQGRALTDAYHFADALESGLAGAFGQAFNFIGSLADPGARDLANNLSHAHDLANELLFYFVDDFASDLANAHELARTIELATRRVIEQAIKLADNFAATDHFAHTNFINLTDNLTHVSDYARFVDDYLEGRVNDSGARSQAGQPRSANRTDLLARWLVTVATQLLPAGDRARYAEEFRSDLWEIVQAEGRCHTQLAYAARQVLSTPRLRRGLRTPRRRSALL